LKIVAGVDEVGRGPLAGPVVAAAVTFAQGYQNPQIQDSKKLTQKKRELLIEQIHRDSIDWSIVSVPPVTIDEINIRQATRLAMSLAVDSLKAEFVLVDGNMEIDVTTPQETVVGGDRKHVEISAASILAKVWRDQYMERLGERYAVYGFAQHAGYPTSAHRRAIAEFGPCIEHRRSFKGVREHLGEVVGSPDPADPLILRKSLKHFA
jgi:ribonuclease HII